MKKIAIIVIMLIITMSASSQAIDETKLADAKKVYKNAIVMRPLATIISLSNHMADFVSEGQTANNNKLSSVTICESGIYSTASFLGLNVGVNYNPGGNYLSGLYIGAYPGVSLVYANKFYLGANIMLELGCQYVFEGGFLIGGYLGYGFGYLDITSNLNYSEFLYGIKAGFAW